jgi:integrase
MAHSWTFVDFEEYVRSRGYAPRTIYEYCKWVRRLLRWCELRELDIEELQPRQMAEWAATLPTSWASRKQAHTAIKHLAAWRGLPDGYYLAIRKPRKPQSRCKALPEHDARQLHATAVMVGGRHGTAVLLMLYTAARVGEVAGMRWDGWAEGRLRWWRPKLGDWHEVPVHPTLARQLEVYREQTGEPSHYLFPGGPGRPHVATQTVWEWLSYVARVAGIGHVTPHQLRATALTIINETTGDLRAAQEVAGHRDPEVTATYTRVTDRMLAGAIGALDAYADHGADHDDNVGGSESQPEAPPAACEADHWLALEAVYTDVDRFHARQRDGRSSYHLEQEGRSDLLPDKVYGTCSCGVHGEALATWQQARQWCRSHREALGLTWQSQLSEEIQVRS